MLQTGNHAGIPEDPASCAQNLPRWSKDFVACFRDFPDFAYLLRAPKLSRLSGIQQRGDLNRDKLFRTT